MPGVPVGHCLAQSKAVDSDTRSAASFRAAVTMDSRCHPDAWFATVWWHLFSFAEPECPICGDPVPMGADNYDEWRAAITRRWLRGMLEDYRAGLVVNADRNSGHRYRFWSSHGPARFRPARTSARRLPRPNVRVSFPYMRCRSFRLSVMRYGFRGKVSSSRSRICRQAR